MTNKEINKTVGELREALARLGSAVDDIDKLNLEKNVLADVERTLRLAMQENVKFAQDTDAQATELDDLLREDEKQQTEWDAEDVVVPIGEDSTREAKAE